MKKCNLVILIVICLLVANPLSARYKDIPVTRDLNPDRKYITYEEYKQAHPFKPTRCSEINRVISDDRDENFLIIVESNLYPQITGAIATYQNDLTNEGFNSFLVEFDGTSAFDMKYYMMLYFQEEDIVGVMLIGDLPIAWFEMFEDWNNNGIWDPDESWVSFPIELYFSDIDGIWEDEDNNGIYDYHEGEKHPEIGVGRIKADNMSYLASSEAELVNSYFQKNHLYRNGFLQNTGVALAYIDDDWSYWGPEYQAAMQFLYPETELVDDINQTTAEDYRTNRLTAEYEFIQVHVHSGPDAHHFCEDNGNTWNLVTNFEISYLNPTSFFYNLFACSNSRFTESNNMGGMYLLGNGYCVGTIGSTKTGSMLWFEDFYEPLSLDETLGEALRQWWELSVDTGPDWMWERSWFYGMAIQGDPSLKIHYIEANIAHVPQDYPTIQQAIDAVENGTLVLVDPGTYFENINFNGKNITIASLFYTTQDTSYISQTIIDGNQDGSVVTFENAEDSTAVLCGFTITNGMGIMIEEGGGIQCWGNSNPNLHNLIIKDNFAYFGGGIYCYNSSPIIHNLTVMNNVLPTSIGSGGGIFLYNSNSIITNVNINDNFSYHRGGGIGCIGSNPILKNVIISENIAAFGGGGIFLTATTITLSNVVINHNDTSGGLSSDGGGIYSINSVSVLTNVTIAENTTWGEYGGIYCKDNSNFTLLNCILWNDSVAEIYLEDSSIDIVYSDIQNGWEGEGNIDEDPLFVNPLENDFHLQDTSPCIGAGIDEIEINGTWYYAPLFDIEGNPRPDPVGSMPDMGAYENPLGEPQVGITQNQLPSTDCHLTNYPNPFNPAVAGASRSPATTIYFSVAQSAVSGSDGSLFVTIEIYNIKGQKVRELKIDNLKLKINKVVWDGTNENNQPVSSGIFFYKLNVDGKTKAVKKMILLK